MIKIGIIGPSEIALRRFLPALKKLDIFKYIGVAIASEKEWDSDSINASEDFGKTYKVEKEKAAKFVDGFGGNVFESYIDIIHSNEIDAIYLPLPPALHYKWASIAIKAGKHVFVYHNQLSQIDNIIKSGKMGDVRLYRISFGFPRRASNDFRYNKSLGGGALLDCGGYTLKYASILLGQSSKVVCAQSNFVKEFDVDISGSATLINDNKTTVQVSFGMDNSYKCDLEVWGSLGCLTTGRVFTAPEGFYPKAKLTIGNDEEIIHLPADDTFKKSINKFYHCIMDKKIRQGTFNEIVKQSELIDSFVNYK